MAPDASAAPAVQLRGLSKRFGASDALADVSLTVMPGETVCIVGPSGSGKSTLLRCINWLERPDAGEVIIHGARVGYHRSVGGAALVMTERELARIRARIGMVFQHFNLWPHLTVLGNVIEAPVHVLRVPVREAVAEAEALLTKVGLVDKLDAYPAALSGGQMQRVAIARALAMHPQVLLFDEPTSALDPELVGEVLDVMKELSREGLTMIVVTHEMKFARDVASRIVFLDHGRIVEVGPARAFFESPTTERARQFLDRYR
jgi:polar amino acid transport system ATP-binding protein